MIKRAIDVVISLTLTILTAPLVAVLALPYPARGTRRADLSPGARRAGRAPV